MSVNTGTTLSEALDLPGNVADADGLVDENRKVLRHSVSKVRSEHTNVKAATIAHTNHGLGIDLISDA